MYYTDNLNKDNFVPKRFESDGEIVLHGEKVKYHTVSEDNVFYKNGKPIASIFSYSYFRTDVDDPMSRPVLFCFNGGPGTSSVYVHAGFLAPKRVHYEEKENVVRPTSLPPYDVVDNEECMLDVADLVIIDPVGVGYGVLLDEEEKKTFYGVDEDAESLVQFVEMWMQRYKRFMSPKYLVGESYGCTRASTAAGITVMGGKEKTYGVRFDGLILIGNTVSNGSYFRQGMQVETCVLDFPTYAAINWYHRHPSSQTVEEFVKEAKEFADRDYLLALYKGEGLTKEERKEIIKKINYYAGVSEEYLNRNALRIDEDTFRAEVLKERGLAVGRCDGRFTRDLFTPGLSEDKFGMWDDAMMDSYDGYFYAVLCNSILPSLNIEMDRDYVMSQNLWQHWNKETPDAITAERLRSAMNQTLGMRTFFMNGWYDACTEIGLVYYVINHSGLPKDRIFVKGYPSGHMIYLGEENVKLLSEDIVKFIKHEEIEEN